jgi:hypothetical protein
VPLALFGYAVEEEWSTIGERVCDAGDVGGPGVMIVGSTRRHDSKVSTS